MSFKSVTLASKVLKFVSQSVMITEKIISEFIPAIVADLLLT